MNPIRSMPERIPELLAIAKADPAFHLFAEILWRQGNCNSKNFAKWCAPR
jgi:hypothetical protein